LIGHLATEWQRTLPPNHHTVMVYTTTKPEYTLRVTIDFEDEAGYQWRRADISPPKRMGKEPVQPGGFTSCQHELERVLVSR
jgi:hypothetical protein